MNFEYTATSTTHTEHHKRSSGDGEAPSLVMEEDVQSTGTERIFTWDAQAPSRYFMQHVEVETLKRATNSITT